MSIALNLQELLKKILAPLGNQINRLMETVTATGICHNHQWVYRSYQGTRVISKSVGFINQSKAIMTLIGLLEHIAAIIGSATTINEFA